MFKIGDLIEGRKESARVYAVTTCRKNFVGRVLERYDDGEIRVEVIRSLEAIDIGVKFWVDEKYFQLCKDNVVTLKRLELLKKLEELIGA